MDSICQPLLIARQKAAARSDGLAALGLQTFGRFQKRKQQLFFNIFLRDGTFGNIPDRAVTDMGVKCIRVSDIPDDPRKPRIQPLKYRCPVHSLYNHR